MDWLIAIGAVIMSLPVMALLLYICSSIILWIGIRIKKKTKWSVEKSLVVSSLILLWAIGLLLITIGCWL